MNARLLALFLVVACVFVAAEDLNATPSAEASPSPSVAASPSPSPSPSPTPTLSITAESKLYALAGETASYEEVVASKVYYLLSFNGREGVVLRKSDLKPVQDPVELKQVAGEYLAKHFDDFGVAEKKAAFDANVGTAEDIVDFCVSGVHFFVAHNTAQHIYINVAPNMYPKSHAALPYLEEKEPLLNASMASLRSSVESFTAAAEARSADRVISALSGVSSQADSVKTYYDNVSYSVEQIYSEFPNAGHEYYFMWVSGQERDCASSANLTATLDAIKAAAVLEGFKDSAALAAQIDTETLSRLPHAEKLKLAASKQALLDSFSSVVGPVLAEYSAYGLSLPLLVEKYSQLNASMAALNASTALNDSQAKALAFDSLYTESVQAANQYVDLFASYESAKKAVNNASDQINEVVRKYGNTDDRVVELQANLQGLRSTVAAQEQAMQDGNVNGSLAEMDSVSLNATAIAVAAASMQPRENEVDWVMIGGVAVLLLALIGGLIYFKKFREEQPPQGLAPVKGEDTSTSASPGTLLHR